MAKRRKSHARKSERARHVVTFNMPPSHAAVLVRVADLAQVSVDTVASVILAMGILRELAKLPDDKLQQAGRLEQARRLVRRANGPRWRAKITNRKMVAGRRR